MGEDTISSLGPKPVLSEISAPVAQGPVVEIPQPQASQNLSSNESNLTSPSVSEAQFGTNGLLPPTPDVIQTPTLEQPQMPASANVSPEMPTMTLDGTSNTGPQASSTVEQPSIGLSTSVSTESMPSGFASNTTDSIQNIQTVPLPNSSDEQHADMISTSPLPLKDTEETPSINSEEVPSSLIDRIDKVAKDAWDNPQNLADMMEAAKNDSEAIKKVAVVMQFLASYASLTANSTSSSQ